MPLWAQRCLVAMLGRVNERRHSSVSRRGLAYAFSQFDSLFTYDWSQLNEHPEHTNSPVPDIELFANSCGVFGFAFIACWCIICFAFNSRVDSHSGHADTFCHSQLIRSTLVLSFSSSLNQQSRPISIGISYPGDRITVADNC